MRHLFFFILLLISIVFFSGCASETKTELEYEETKQMIVDILKTDEGKKALVDILTDEELKEHLTIETDIVKKTINDTLISDKGKKMWKQLFADPDFVKQFHSSIVEEQKGLFKQLMNDATFQKQLMDLLQNPEMDKAFLQLMKSQQFKEHLESLITETIENPIYRAKLQKDIDNKKEDEEK